MLSSLTLTGSLRFVDNRVPQSFMFQGAFMPVLPSGSKTELHWHRTELYCWRPTCPLITRYTHLNNYRTRVYLIICSLSLALSLLSCPCTPAARSWFTPFSRPLDLAYSSWRSTSDWSFCILHCDPSSVAVYSHLDKVYTNQDSPLLQWIIILGCCRHNNWLIIGAVIIKTILYLSQDFYSQWGIFRVSNP